MTEHSFGNEMEISEGRLPFISIKYYERGKMQGFGALLIIWGILDFVLGESGTDIYYEWFGIYLPDAIYDYSHWLAMFAGSLLIGAGRRSRG